MLDQPDLLPAPQVGALLGALALGPPAPGDRLGVCVAALAVLRAAARCRPVLVVVDDVQWVDASSRECIEYLARRAAGWLAVVLAARDPGYPPARVGVQALPIGPVDDAVAAELLRHRAPGLAPPVAAAVRKAAAGNPLALVELPAMLTADQRSGVADLGSPLAPGARLHRAFKIRVDALVRPARQALLIAAAHTGTDAAHTGTELSVVASACRRGGTDVAHLGEAEARGLVRLGAGRVAFVHPLLRGMVYREARGDDRRAAHAALAEVLDDDRRVWHLAAALVGTDEDVAASLERIGDQAVARRAYAAGSDALEQAARLTCDREAGSRRLISAGQAASGAGMGDRALALFTEAGELTSAVERRAQAQHLRGRTLVMRGRAVEAVPLLVSQARCVAARLPARAAMMYADAANGATTVMSYVEAEQLARRAAAHLGEGGDPAARGAVLTMLGVTLLLRGKDAQARSALAGAARMATGLDPLGPHWPWLHVLLRSRVQLGEFEGRSRRAWSCAAAHGRRVRSPR